MTSRFSSLSSIMPAVLAASAALAQGPFVPTPPVLRTDISYGRCASVLIEDLNQDGNNDIVALYDPTNLPSVAFAYHPNFPVSGLSGASGAQHVFLGGDVLDRGSFGGGHTTEGVLRSGFCFPAPAAGPRYRDMVVPVFTGSTPSTTLIMVLRNPGAGAAPAWSGELQSLLGLTNCQDVALEDMNGDGLDDLITLHRSVSVSQGPEIQIFWNRSALGVPASQVFQTSDRTRYPLAISSGGIFPKVLEVMKANGTKRIAYADVRTITSAGASMAHVLALSARGVVPPFVTVVSSTALQGEPATMMARDFNGDGVDDLAIGFQGGVLNGNEVHFFAASGVRSASQSFGYLGVRDLAAVDVNGDGVKDLLSVEEELDTAPDLVAYVYNSFLGRFGDSRVRISSGLVAPGGDEWMSNTYSVAIGVLGGQGGEAIIAAGNPEGSAVGGVSVLQNNVAANWSLSGSRCSGLNWPSISLVQRAFRGTNYQIDITGAPLGSVGTLVAIGFANGAASLASIGMPGCWAYSATDSILLLPSAAQQPARLSIPIPANPALVGLPFFQQAAVHAPGLNAQALATSQLVTSRVL